MPQRQSKPTGALILNARHDLLCENGLIAKITIQWNELNQYLIQYDFVEYAQLWMRSECLGHLPSTPAASFDQLSDACPP